MHVDTDPDISRLRAVLRDLVALSGLPAVWSGREPAAVATGLADELVESFQLDFAFVRLCDPDGRGAVEVTRGDVWERFPEWLERHRALGVRFPLRELVADVGSGSEPCRGFAIGIGVDGEAGVVATACRRSDFPTSTDQLLLSVASNQAATAFQTARLIQALRDAEVQLREARDELEVKVAERTAELRRSESYLAEAQRLTHTGSFAIDVATREVTHSSAEHARLYGFDPERGASSLSGFLQRIHPRDRAKCTEALESGLRGATNIDVEYRVVLPEAPVRHHRAIAHPVFGASGELEEVVGTIVDVTERRQAESELGRLAGEQAALRRVATLVARGALPTAVFDAVAAEMERLLDADQTVLSRYESGAEVTVVAHRGPSAHITPPGSRVSLDGENVQALVRRHERPARIEHFQEAHGAIADMARAVGVRSVVGAPIVVDGRLWGVISVSWNGEESPPADTEERMAKFAELLDTAIANADSHDALTASRARLLAAGDEARRRVVRDLHDGAQQRLVQCIVTLKLAQRALRQHDGDAESLVGEALEQAQQGNAELRELARGILPTVLTRGGLRAGVDAVVARLDLPVDLDVSDERFSPEVEASAYFIVAEALTNVVKHAQARRAEVRTSVKDGMLQVEVRDDGIGGADPGGHGLVGLGDRATALGGLLKIENAPAGGTVVTAALPLSAS